MLLARQNRAKHPQLNSAQYSGPGSFTVPNYAQAPHTDNMESGDVSEVEEDIEEIIEKMHVTIQTMNTLKEILNLQKTEKSPTFKSESFKHFFPSDIYNVIDKLN